MICSVGRKFVAVIAVAFIAICACDKNTNDEGGRGVTVDSSGDVSTPAQETLGQYHALIIGINDYKKWPPLEFAYQDAEDLRTILTTRYRFEPENVSFLGNDEASQSNIISVLTRLLSSLSEKDNLLVYYAGHGQLDPLTDSGYWIPVDGEIYDETSWIRFSTITEKITSRNVNLKNILLITDSCYGGALSRSGPTPGKSNPEQNGELEYLSSLAEISNKPSRQVVASGGFEEVPDQSVFAELLKQNLRDNQLPLIDVEYMFFRNILPDLIRVGTQRPRISKLASGLDIDGQFIFALRDAELTDSTTESDSFEPSPTPYLAIATATPEAAVEAPDPNITVFTATPLEVQAGEMVSVSWETENAVAVSLNGSTVASSGATRVLPPETPKFTLKAVNADGKVVSSTLAIEVLKTSAKINQLVASPNKIVAGQAATITWSTSDALSTVLEPIGSVEPIGSRELSPSKTTTYTLRAKGATGEIRRSLTLVVTAPAAEILTFTASNTKIKFGSSSTLSWSVKNADTVTLNDKKVSTKGRLVVKPSKTTSYEIVARSRSGDVTRKRIGVTVIPRISVLTPVTTPILVRTLTQTVASGTTKIKQTFRADLDTSGAPSNNDADIWFQAKTATDRWIMPRGRAQMAYIGSKAPGLKLCKSSSLRSAGVNIRRLKVGDYLCVKTTQGHFSQVKITALPAPRVGTLGIQFTTWK